MPRFMAGPGSFFACPHTNWCISSNRQAMWYFHRSRHLQHHLATVKRWRENPTRSEGTVPHPGSTTLCQVSSTAPTNCAFSSVSHSKYILAKDYFSSRGTWYTKISKAFSTRSNANKRSLCIQIPLFHDRKLDLLRSGPGAEVTNASMSVRLNASILTCASKFEETCVSGLNRGKGPLFPDHGAYPRSLFLPAPVGIQELEAKGRSMDSGQEPFSNTADPWWGLLTSSSNTRLRQAEWNQ